MVTNALSYITFQYSSNMPQKPALNIDAHFKELVTSHIYGNESVQVLNNGVRTKHRFVSEFPIPGRFAPLNNLWRD